MLTFKEFVSLQEGFEIDSFGKFIRTNSQSGISSSFGKDSKLTPFKKTIEGSGIISYSLYSSKDGGSDIVKVLKRELGGEEYQKFLIRSAIYASRVMRDLKVDIIVMPQSSSELLINFSKELKKRVNVEIFINSFKKQENISDIKIDNDNPKLTDKIYNSIEKILSRAKRENFFSIKSIHPAHRKFIKNLFDVYDERIISKIENKSVLILDDVMTSGTTTNNIANKLKEYGANSVQALTLFKS